MSQDDSSSKDRDDEQDMVMPGFRFRPTEEELVEFYLRRKVEGKHFNVELITFLHLYRYDPWELPALAAIGEKEWYFYVPRDRKYRNGDRPNRVTTSGYWKATGADRMIRGESFRAIGLKKTLVFYFGKAPKGIRTSWIMNEYRLPHHETQSLQKAEISLCRVHKRAGVEDHPSLPRSLPTRASSSRGIQSDRKQQDANQHGIDRFQAFGGQAKQVETEKMSEASGSSSTEVGTAFVLSGHGSHIGLAPMAATNNISQPPSTLEEDLVLLHRAKQTNSIPHNSTSTVLTASSFVSPNGDDDLQRLVNYQQISITHQQQCHNNYHSHPSHFSNLQPLPHPRLLAPNVLTGSLQAAFPDKLWEWNSITEASKDYIGSFK